MTSEVHAISLSSNLRQCMEGYICTLGTGRIYVCWDRYGRYAYFLEQVRKGIPKQWRRYGRVYYTYVYFLGTGVEGYTCNLGTGRQKVYLYSGTDMEGYACVLRQVRRGIPVQWHRYGRVYYTYIFLGQILKGIPAIWEQVGKGIPVF